MNHYTYWLTSNQPVNGAKYYIGKRSTTKHIVDDEMYLSSSDYVKEAIKNGIIFKKRVLATWDSAEEALSHEILLHDYFDVGRNPEFFNRAKQTSTGFDTTGNKEVAALVSKARKGKPLSLEHRRKIAASLPDISGVNNPMYGYAYSEEQRKQKSIQTSGKNNPMFGKTQSDLSKQKNREKQLGKKQSEETRLKRSIAMTGKEINKTIYTLTHPTHGTVSGTKQFFKNTYGLASSAVSKVLSGVYKSTRGWSL